MYLEILIASVYERQISRNLLINELEYQKSNLNSDVIVLISTNTTETKFNGGPSIGFKRWDLLNNTYIGNYVCFIDDDDWIAPNYLQSICNAVKQKPDVITFNGKITTDNLNVKNFEIKLGNPYQEINGIYYRPPNHLCPIKKSIALEINYDFYLHEGEDYDYCTRLQVSNLVKTEIHIPEELYQYNYKTTNKLY